MPGEIRTLFVPFGELKPDAKLFNNDGLLQARNVVPVHGGYVTAQQWTTQGDRPSDAPYGLRSHFAGGSTWYAHLGTVTKLYQGDTFTSGSPTWRLVDKSRLVGGAYNTSAAGGENGWQGTSFGDSFIMTNYVDDPQILVTSATANYVKLAQSGGANPGMDPKAKFAFPVKNNLFLANLNLAAPFDTLPAGANPTVVCWSQSDNVRQFGSKAVTAQLTGTGYQPLNYDLGHITGGVGGDFGVVALQQGFVRVDGPEYTFRPTVVGQGCRYPNSIIRIGDDVYFWGAGGPSVLRGGEGPVEVLGTDKVRRTLIDNTTGFSPTYSISDGLPVRFVCAGRDVANDLVFWSYMAKTNSSYGGFTHYGNISVVYNINDGRFAFTENTESGLGNSGVTFFANAPDLGRAWGPGRDLIGVVTWDGLPGVGANLWGLGIPLYSFAGASLPTLERAYQQLDTDLTTRVRRVRPVYSRSDLSSAITVTVTVSSKNKPYDNPTVRTASTEDSHGWIPVPDSVLADFHSVKLGYQGTATDTVIEFEGFELEFEAGGRYSA